jgi:predicted dehydrogenase
VKIVFFGLGSIGSRHARILLEEYAHDVFAFRSHRANREVDDDLAKIKEVHTWNEVEEIKPDVAFITNPTFLHIETAMKCASLGIKLFIEKPVDCTTRNLDALLEEVRKRQLVTYVAYNLRFHPVISFLREYVQSKRISHVSIYNSSYLPNWRPGQDYTKSYSVSKEKGGGVILELSHEFDYIEYLFGSVESIDGVFDKVSDIAGDCEDFLDAAINTERTYVNLHLNFCSFLTERTIKIDCDEQFISADLINGEVRFITVQSEAVEKYEADRNETFRKQIRYFFDNVDNNRMMNNLFEASSLFRKILKFRNRLQ